MPNLNNLPALDAAIGLAFLFFLLSTVCSAVNEGIANVLGWRAKTLEDAVRNLVGDPEVKRGWKEWIGQIHKLAPDAAGSGPLGALRRRLPGGKREQDPAAEDASTTSAGAPAPAGNLTESVFDHWRIRALVRNPDSRLRRRRRPSYLPPPAFSLAIAERLAQGPPGEPDHGLTPWAQADADIWTTVKSNLDGLPPGRARAFLLKAAANADGHLDGFRVQLEHGFDDAMERASGWYKRKVQLMLAVISAVVVIGFNVDTVHVATVLWRDAPVRSAVASQAAKQADTQTAADAAAKVDQLQLPVGWGKNTPDPLLNAVPGWLIAIAALNLGAPFWFDLLSRFARLRGGGVPERPRSLNDSTGTVDGPRSSTRKRVAAHREDTSA